MFMSVRKSLWVSAEYCGCFGCSKGKVQLKYMNAVEDMCHGGFMQTESCFSGG